jgi:hypothetical protein
LHRFRPRHPKLNRQIKRKQHRAALQPALQ